MTSVAANHYPLKNVLFESPSFGCVRYEYKIVFQKNCFETCWGLAALLVTQNNFTIFSLPSSCCVNLLIFINAPTDQRVRPGLHEDLPYALCDIKSYSVNNNTWIHLDSRDRLSFRSYWEPNVERNIELFIPRIVPLVMKRELLK